MRRVLLRKSNKIGFSFENLSHKNVVVREASTMDMFCTEVSVSADDNKKCVAYTDPIRMLFNQQRLNSIGTSAVNQWLDSLKNFKKDPLAEIRAKCTDAELKAMIKSRNIQQPSEIMAWAEWCQENVDMFNKELQKVIEEQKKQAELNPVPQPTGDDLKS